MTIFENKVFAAVQKIPRGRISTYGLVARAAGRAEAARAVGNVLHKNKELIIIPCHRVVRSDGNLGGFVLGAKNKSWLLQKEGIKIKNGRIINFYQKLYKFNK